MSLVFLKSADDKQDGRYNPNKPYRFSNYLTNPITIPKNAQVAYVSSQFLVDGNGVAPDEPSYISTGEDELDMFEMPVMFKWQSDESRTANGWQSIINSWALSSNEFGMDGDFTPAKFGVFAGASSVPQAISGFKTLYSSTDNKVSIWSNIRFPVDVYNLYFNAYRTNPSYNGASWIAGGSGQTGATIIAGLNFSTNDLDQRYEEDCRIRSRNAPSGSTSFIGGNCYGFRVGLETNLFNARNRVYEGGANWYNTGFSSTQLDGNSFYQFGGGQGASASLPDFNAGRYAITMGTTGLKKCVGDFTPNNSQQNNRGGHQAIGHLESGGYCIWTNCNLQQSVANAHYTVANSTKEGFCGFAPQFVGLHSIPYIRQKGYDIAVNSGVSPTDARNIDTQIDNWLKVCDLNNSSSPNTAENADARYLIGLDILNEGTAPNVDCVVRAKVLDTINGTIQNSQYKEIGSYDGASIGGFKGLSLRSLSQGVNTACNPPHTFDLTANYSINVYDTTSGRTPAGLFFRFRWENKFQIAIEFTLSVDGFFGTYNNATDEPYAPYALPDPTPTPSSRQIRLDATTTGDTVNVLPGENINFLDSGGAGGDYNPNENYNIVFVAPAGQVLQMTINTFEFEQSNIAYDRMGIRISDDGVNWVNISEKGFQSMQVEDNPNNPSDSNERIYSVPGQPQNSNNGWVFPGTTTFFTSQLGGDISKTFNFGARYMQFRFISDGSAQEPGWDLNIFPTDQNENDPRNKWCLLGKMDVIDLFVEKSYYIPPLMGDLGIVQYPIAPSSDTNKFRQQVKGWFDPRETNRFFRDNNNGNGKQYAPYTFDNPFFGGYDSLGVWTFQPSFPDNPDYTSSSLVNAGYDGTDPTIFTPNGTLESATRKWLGVKLDYPLQFKSFRTTAGFPARTPRTELAYIFGFLTTNQVKSPVDIPVNALLVPSGSYNLLQAPNDVDATNEAFSNHVQITNLPIISSNGVVSSICKTIYVVDSLCIHDTHDNAEYRYFCHQAPYPLWIDLNNLEEIQLNKIDVLIAQDNNTEQIHLTGETQIVIMFRSKEEGVLPNTISVKNISTTRTY
jgi:hypothetical protein